MALSRERNKPSSDLSNYVIFLAGDKKVGKTSFCAQFPDHFIFEFEAGNAKHLECTYADVSDLKTFEKLLKEAENTPWLKTLVLDEITYLYDMIMNDICEKEDVMDLIEIGYGRGWGMVKRIFQEYLRRIQGIGCGVIYTAHTEIKTIKTRQSREVSKIEANLAKQVGKDMDRLVHIWAVMQFGEESRRIMHIEGDDLLKAGHGFKGQCFKHVEKGTIFLGNSAKEAYRNFMDAWNNKPIQEEVSSPVTATPSKSSKNQKGKPKARNLKDQGGGR